MKKFLLLLPLILTIILVVVFIACEEEPEEFCQQFDQEKCNAPEPYTTCCDDDNCYYSYEGVKYYCVSEDNCIEAENNLIDAMCDVTETAIKNEIRSKINSQTLKLLMKVRANAELY